MGKQGEEAPSGVVLVVKGQPRPQPRPRFVGRGVVSTTGPAKVWRDQVERAGAKAVRNLGGPAAVRAILGDGPVDVGICFFGTRRQARGDIDNLAKLVLDALVKVGALGGDDRRVADLHTWKKTGADWTGCAVLIQRAREVEAGQGQGQETRSAPGWLSGAVGRR